MTGELVPRTNSSHITKKDSKESTLFTAFSNYFDRAGTPATLYLTWLYEDSMSPYLDFSFPISSSCQGKQNKIRRTSTDSRESDTTDHSRNKKEIRWISLGEIQGIKSDHTLSKCKSIRPLVDRALNLNGTKTSSQKCFPLPPRFTQCCLWRPGVDQASIQQPKQHWYEGGKGSEGCVAET